MSDTPGPSRLKKLSEPEPQTSHQNEMPNFDLPEIPPPQFLNETSASFLILKNQSKLSKNLKLLLEQYIESQNEVASGVNSLSDYVVNAANTINNGFDNFPHKGYLEDIFQDLDDRIKCGFDKLENKINQTKTDQSSITTTKITTVDKSYDHITNNILRHSQKIMVDKNEISDFDSGNIKTILQLATQINRHFDQNSPRSGPVKIGDLASIYEFLHPKSDFLEDVDTWRSGAKINNSTNSNNSNDKVFNFNNGNQNYDSQTMSTSSSFAEPPIKKRNKNLVNNPINHQSDVARKIKKFKDHVNNCTWKQVQNIYNDIMREMMMASSEEEKKLMKEKIKVLENAMK